MNSNGLDFKVTVENYKKKSVDEKLDILYQVGLTHQKVCEKTTEKFNKRISNLELNRKLEKAKIAGIGGGSGLTAFGIFEALKALFKSAGGG